MLGIPTDPTAAAAVAAQGVERMIDVAEVDGVPYLGIASFGFDSDANRIANEARLIRGNLVYLYAALRALAAWKPAAFTVTVDGERHEIEGYSVGAANSKAYGGGMWAAPQAELDDGLLDVVACGRSSKAHFLFSMLPRVFKGTHLVRPLGADDDAARPSRSTPTARSPSTPTAIRSAPCPPPSPSARAACG